MQGFFAQGLKLGREGSKLHAVHRGIFGKGERIELHLVVPSRQVGGQFAAQQLGVGSRDEQVHFLAKQPIDKQLPALDVLHLVEEEILEIAVYLIQGVEHAVEIGGFQPCQSVVVEVGVGKFHSLLPYELLAQSGFSASPHTYHNLGKVARRRELPFLHPVAQQRQVVCQQFFLLVGKDGHQSSCIHVIMMF